FSVFSGANGHTGSIPPYLVGAAAMESRAFPAFVFDPAAGSDWASRFHLDGNQQADRDWPVQRFVYEDDHLQRVSEEVPFTLVDFVACDRRFARHFARVPREHWNGTLTSVGESLHESKVESPKSKVPDRVPSVLMVDQNNVLQRVLVDDVLIRETRRCTDMWHSLQELGGVRNSHAERLLEKERKVWEDQMALELASRKPEPAAAADSLVQSHTDSPAQPAADSSAAVTEPVEEKKSDDPYIETPRCTTCNECTTINNKMFAYNENKQAYIADPSAGTYKQLVEAAESCQVSIIHPGKPKNPNEPGIEELLKRAEPFL
ncbi:MAG: ferredoxin, partial [Fimbriimonadales bacterium]